jgi:hypothetical protein
VFRVRAGVAQRATWWWVAAALVLALVIVSLRALVQPDPSPGTLRVFIARWGTMWGWTDTILQYLYYVTEGLAMVWLVDAFDTAGDAACPRFRFPWGALALSLLWGGGHYFTKDVATAVYAMTAGLAIGGMYFFSGKRLLPPLSLWMLLNFF